jgi:hypothetical protein
MVVAVAAVVLAAGGVASAVTSSNTSVNRSPLSKLSEGQSQIFWTVGVLQFRHTCEAGDPRFAGGKSRIFVEGQSFPPNTAGGAFGELSNRSGRGVVTSTLTVAVDGREFRQLIVTNGSAVLGADCTAQVIMFSD